MVDELTFYLEDSRRGVHKAVVLWMDFPLECVFGKGRFFEALFPLPAVQVPVDWHAQLGYRDQEKCPNPLQFLASTSLTPDVDDVQHGNSVSYQVRQCRNQTNGPDGSDDRPIPSQCKVVAEHDHEH